MVVYNHCSDTAAAVARYMAIGDTSKAKQARQNAPTGATISVIERSTTVEVVVSADERFGLIGPIHLVSSFTQLKEPK
jgi:hypothetical protein